jgi:cell division septation protein DedD
VSGNNIPKMPENVQTMVFQLEEERVFNSLNTQADAAPQVSIKKALEGDGRTFPVTPEAAAEKDSQISERDVGSWMVQVASFSEEKNATALRDQLRAKNFPTYVKTRKDKDSTTYQIRVGPELTVKRAESLRAEIEKSTGLKGLVVRNP